MAQPRGQTLWSGVLLLLALLAAAPARVQAAADSAADPVSTSLAIINGFLVFFMQVGFLAFETGSGRAKNVRNILLKNLLDVMLAALVWWAVGYAFAYGSSAGGIIGTSNFFYEGGSLTAPSSRPWFFSWTFAIAAATIISGSLAERTCLAAYPAATLLIVGFVHPLLVHAIWSPAGWLSRLSRCQVLDFAGGLVVHMLGGLFGLLGAWRAGPRLGRFESREPGDDDDDDDDDGGDDTQQQCSDEQQQQQQRQAAGGGGGPVLDSARELLAHPGPPWHHHHHQQQQQQDHAAPPPAGALELPGLDAQAAAAAAAASGSGATFPGWPGGARQVMPTTGSGVPDPGAAAAVAAGELDGAAAGGAAAGATALPVHQPAARRSGGPAGGSSSAGWRGALGLWGGGALRGAGRGGRRCHWRRGRGRLVAKPMPGHDMALVTLGTFMLWFGWFGFNNGSVYMYVSNSPSPARGSVSAELVQRASMNTSLGGAAGGLAALLVAALFSGTYDLRVCCNGVLSGLVTVTCMCGFVDPWAAVVCASIAGAAYPAVSSGLLAAGIDDPLDSSSVHLFNGLLGSLLLAFVAKPDYVTALTGSTCGGIFYSSTGWQQLGLQLLGVAVVALFAGGAALLLFSVLARLKLLRVDTATELAGIDAMDHGGPAYELHPAVAGRRIMA